EHLNLSSRKSWVWKGSWILGVLWFLDILSIPTRLIQTVPDPYRNTEVRNAAARAGQLIGTERMVSLKEEGRLYPAENGSLSGSVLEAADELVPNTNVVWGLRSARGYLTIFTDGFQNLNHYLKMGYPYDGRILDSVGTRLIIGANPLSAFKYHSSEQRGSSIWTQNAGALAEAWKVDQVREFPDRPALFEALLDPKAFLENEVYTEKSPGGGAVCLARTHRPTLASGVSFWDRLKNSILGWIKSPTTIEVTRPSPCEASFLISSDRPGFLVFNESFSPGWHA